MENDLYKKFGGEKRWVNWRLEEVNGKLTKVPYMKNGRKASSTNPKTWTKLSELEGMKHGIVLHDGKLICIDIDHILVDGKLEHDEKERIAEIILEADTYTEVSQSGTGLHLFLSVVDSVPEIHNHKKAPFEVYSTGRYIAVTGNQYGAPRDVRTVTKEEAERIINIAIQQNTPMVREVVEGVSTGNRFSDEELLAKMFASKNGAAVKSLYEGDLSKHKGDPSSADMALCSHLAFWTGRNAEQMERMWLASGLGKREKTLERKDYRDRTIANAIKNCKEAYEPPSIDFVCTPNSRGEMVPVMNTENIERILRLHEEFKGKFRYDDFIQMFQIFDDKKKAWRTLEDVDAIVTQARISVLFKVFARVSKNIVYDAICAIAKENRVDTAKDFITGLKWDGVARVDQWLMHTYGVEDNEYHRKVGSNWLKGLVKRIVEPGCKFDYVLVLEGEQGVKKSTSLYILGGAWHAETTMSTDTKDFFMQFAGKAIIEFSEGETLSRTEVKRMKAIITMQFDRYRTPYERATMDFPRRCVFAMTTNQDEYLKDETGNRRWMPVRVVKDEADVEWLAENREQLFAEAYHRVAILGETVYEFPDEDMMREQAQRMIHDPNEDLIAEWYYGALKIDEREAGITISQVHIECLNNTLGKKGMSKLEEMQIATSLRNLGLIRKRVHVPGSTNSKMTKWYPPQMSTPSELAKIRAEESDRLF